MVITINHVATPASIFHNYAFRCIISCPSSRNRLENLRTQKDSVRGSRWGECGELFNQVPKNRLRSKHRQANWPCRQPEGQTRLFKQWRMILEIRHLRILWRIANFPDNDRLELHIKVKCSGTLTIRHSSSSSSALLVAIMYFNLDCHQCCLISDHQCK